MNDIAYRDQLAGLVGALSRPNHHQELAAALAAPSAADQVKMFVDGNLDKRLDKLLNQLEFVVPAFDDFEQLAMQYVRGRPLAAFDTGCSDGEGMLSWLAEQHDLTPTQQDYVACQRARHAVERRAGEQRLKYLRFGELHSLAGQLAAQLDRQGELRIHLNPIRCWSRFRTSALLDEATRPPANVMFFAIRGEIATTVLELEGQALLNELADYEPCTIEQWSALSALGSREQLVAFCRDLAEMGLVCFS